MAGGEHFAQPGRNPGLECLWGTEITGKLTRRGLIGAGTAAAVAGGTAFSLRGGPQGRHAVVDARTLNRGNGAEPDTLDPHKADGNWEYNIIADMFMGLMTEDAAGNPMPGAALSYSVSADGLVFTFKLRDHKWSDGVPVTAHDYVFAFRRILNPKTASPYSAILYPIKNALEVNGGTMPPEKVACAPSTTPRSRSPSMCKCRTSRNC